MLQTIIALIVVPILPVLLVSVFLSGCGEGDDSGSGAESIEININTGDEASVGDPITEDCANSAEGCSTDESSADNNDNDAELSE